MLCLSKIDVSKASDVENMINETILKFSKIDILVQNAAIGMKPNYVNRHIRRTF